MDSWSPSTSNEVGQGGVRGFYVVRRWQIQVAAGEPAVPGRNSAGSREQRNYVAKGRGRGSASSPGVKQLHWNAVAATAALCAHGRRVRSGEYGPRITQRSMSIAYTRYGGHGTRTRRERERDGRRWPGRAELELGRQWWSRRRKPARRALTLDERRRGQVGRVEEAIAELLMRGIWRGRCGGGGFRGGGVVLHARAGPRRVGAAPAYGRRATRVACVCRPRRRAQPPIRTAGDRKNS